MTDALLHPPAGFWPRLRAHIVDGLILGVPVMLLYLCLAPFTHWDIAPLLLEALGLAAYVEYHSYFLASRWQATPGKRLFSVYIARASDGARLMRPEAVRRYLVFSLPQLMLLASGILVYAFGVPDIPEGQWPTVAQMQRKAVLGPGLTEEDKASFDEMEAQYAAIPPVQTALEGAVTLFCAGFYLALAATVAFDERKRGLHDRLCGTVALRGRPGVDIYA